MPSTTSADSSHALTPGRNCWRIERATRARVIIDAQEYLQLARKAMLAAERRIMLISWEFDSRIPFGDPESAPDDGAPTTIGDFLPWLVERRPDLEIYLLRWNFKAIKSLLNPRTLMASLRWKMNKRIHVRFDSMHPVGASHHQKIVVIDDCFAFCGGIDMTSRRWDTRDHADDDPRRVDPHGKPYAPWHDATLAVEGPIARALGELARDRWVFAGGEKLEPVDHRSHCWPDGAEPHFENISAAIARTHPKYNDHDVCHEIEQQYVDLIGRARRLIYAESQYFASRKIAEAIIARVRERDGPEIVLVNPTQADGWLEQQAMDNARARLYDAIREHDTHGRFRMYHPITAKGEPIYVHAKILVIDDRVLRVGSSNWNNRSMRLDTECDVTIDADLPDDADAPATIARIRNELLAEHLGRSTAEVTRNIDATGSIIETIKRLSSDARTLRPYQRPSVSTVEKFVADNELLDPEGPDEVLEPIAKRGLFRRLRTPKPRT